MKWGHILPVGELGERSSRLSEDKKCLKSRAIGTPAPLLWHQ